MKSEFFKIKADYLVYGITNGKKFIDKYDLPFPLIADTEKEVIEAFGVWGKKKFMGKIYDGIHRVTYVIDEKGVVIKRFDKVKTKAHAEQILEALNLN